MEYIIDFTMKVWEKLSGRIQSDLLTPIVYWIMREEEQLNLSYSSRVRLKGKFSKSQQNLKLLFLLTTSGKSISMGFWSLIKILFIAKTCFRVKQFFSMFSLVHCSWHLGQGLFDFHFVWSIYQYLLYGQENSICKSSTTSR